MQAFLANLMATLMGSVVARIISGLILLAIVFSFGWSLSGVNIWFAQFSPPTPTTEKLLQPDLNATLISIAIQQTSIASTQQAPIFTSTETHLPLISPPLPTNTPIPLPTSTAININCSPGVVFCDDFSSNPNTNGLWTIFRLNGDGANEASWDEGIGALFLTRALNARGSVVLANYELINKQWTAKFKYKAGGGSGADGFVFFFYKHKYAFKNGSCSGMCFTPDNNYVPGYGIEFDNHYNPEIDKSPNHIALIEGHNSNSLVYVDDFRTEDNRWHDAEVRFNNGRVTVLVDNTIVLDYLIETPNYNYSGIGFSGVTGALNHNHIIDDFSLNMTYP